MEGASTTIGGAPKTPLSTNWYKNTSETFLAQVELETGSGVPVFVQEEFDAFLDFGILATAAQLVDHVIPRVPVRQWGNSRFRTEIAHD